MATYARASTSLALIDVHSIANKLKRKYDLAIKLNASTSSTIKRDNFTKELDSLFGVLECKCRMWRDNDDDPVQIECKCPLSKKIPSSELEFVFTQRHRESKAPALQIGRLDIPATKKLKKKQAKKLREKELAEEHEAKMLQEKLEEKNLRQEQLSEFLASQETDCHGEAPVRNDPDISFDIKGKIHEKKN